jgi:hypothetical protein
MKNSLQRWQHAGIISTGFDSPSKSGATVTRPEMDSDFFYVPCCEGSMAPFLAGRVGTAKAVPVPDSGLSTPHGLPPSFDSEVGRFTTCQSGVIMTTPTTGKSAHITPTEALRAILAEVTPGIRPYSGDSWLPEHLVLQATEALSRAERQDIAAQQHAHTALATASWHIARNELPQALSRLRRATSHIATAMEVVNHG